MCTLTAASTSIQISLDDSDKAFLMPNKFYRRGYNFERRVAQDYERMGWGIIESRGSHGPADIVALRRGFPSHVIQCKTNGKISVEEIKKVLDFAELTGSRPVLAFREGKTLKYKFLDDDTIWSKP